MSQFSETHLACADCGSSDARSIYDSGVSQCFACGVILAPEGGERKPMSERAAKYPVHRDLDFIPLNKRGLTQETCRKYGYGINGSGHQCAPYFNSTGTMVAQKVRGPDKSFMWSGDPEDIGLYGQQLAKVAGKMIVITEGEVDAMSVYQAMGSSWPALSVPNGAQAASAALKARV